MASVCLSDSHPLKEEGPIFEFTDLECTVPEFVDTFVQGRRDENLGDSFISFQSLPYVTFKQISENETSPIAHCRLLYLEDSQTLIVKTTSPEHDSVMGRFGNLVFIKAKEMDLQDDMSTRVTTKADMGTVHKQPDGCWGPLGEKYITLTLEIGKSGSEKRLARDARLWIESVDSHVQQVVTIKIWSDQPRLHFQRWESTNREYQKMRTPRRRIATVTQEAMISLVNGQPRAEGSLCLRFSTIFERDPRPGTPEGDMVFSGEDLFDVARDAWQLMGYLP
jgi:hypothetical protein